MKERLVNMKAILEFNLPEDKEEFDLINKAVSYHSVIFEFNEWLNRKYKHAEHKSDEVMAEYEEIREYWNELTIEVEL